MDNSADLNVQADNEDEPLIHDNLENNTCSNSTNGDEGVVLDGPSEESDVDEEVEEPKLKYERVGNSLAAILSNDAASAIAVHPKFLCLGSRWGIVYLLDHMGHAVSLLNSRELHRLHSVAVNQLSVDERGDCVASCSDDGRVVIASLAGDNVGEKPLVLKLDRRVRCVALDPQYGRSKKRFVTGEQRNLVLHETIMFGRLRTTVLAETEDGDSPIHALCWKGALLAWATESGVRVYDVDETQKVKRSVGMICRNHAVDLKCDTHPCHLCWKDNRTLLIGWADTVKVCTVATRAQPKPDLSHLCVQIVFIFSTDFYVAGLGPFGDTSLLVVLAVSKEPDPITGKAQRPHLYVIEPGVEDYSIECTDMLSVRGYEEYSTTDYRLECLADESLFFIMSLKDIIAARPRDADDHIEWLIQRKNFSEAMRAVEANSRSLRRHSPLEVGRAYLDHLLDGGFYDEAARLCVAIFGRDKKLWEEEVFKFVPVRQLRAVSPYLPTGEDCRLSSQIYEMVLFEYLNTDLEGFLKLVHDWSPALYNVPAISNAVLEHLLKNQIDNPILLEALATLYSHSKKYDKALAMFLRLNHVGVFQLIRQHKLFSVVPAKAEELVRLDEKQAIALCLEFLDEIPPAQVVKRLESKPQYLYSYLDALYRKNGKALEKRYHGTLVELYARYGQKNLLPFLRSSDHYPIHDALEVCKTHQLIPEMVYLLGRMGSTQEALKLITTELMDIDQAITFCKEHDDRDLWDTLIKFSLDKPTFINALLQNIGTHVDPQILIQQIPNEMPIPGLRDSLVKIMHDFCLQISLQEGCRKILVADGVSLHQKLVRTQQKGISVDSEQVCGSCHQPFTSARSSNSRLIIFHCRHFFHENCLPPSQSPSCVICCSHSR